MPPRIKVTTLKSQLIHLIQELSGRTLSEVKAFTLLFGLAFSLALWSEIARVMRLRLWGVPLAVAVVAWAAGFAGILAAAAFRLGWESVVFMLIFLAIWHLAGAEQP